MLSTYYICCIYSNAYQTFIMQENTMDPDKIAPFDKIAPKGTVWSESILFAI